MCRSSQINADFLLKCTHSAGAYMAAGVFKLTDDWGGRCRLDGGVLRRVCWRVAVRPTGQLLAVRSLPVLVEGRDPERVLGVFPQVGQVVLEGNANFHFLVFGEVPLRKEYLRQIYTQRAPRVQRLFKVNWIMRKPFLLSLSGRDSYSWSRRQIKEKRFWYFFSKFLERGE